MRLMDTLREAPWPSVNSVLNIADVAPGVLTNIAELRIYSRYDAKRPSCSGVACG